MEAFETIAGAIINLLDAVAWPATVVIIAVLFRRELRGAVKRLSKFKYKDIEANFEKGLDAAEKEAKESVLSESYKKRLLLKPSAVPQNVERFMSVADVLPQGAIVAVWPLVEEAIWEAAKRLNLSLPERFPNYQIMRVLVERGVVDPEVEGLYKRLRRLRNEAASAHNFDIDTSEAERYIKLALGLVDYLNSTQPK